MIWVIGYFVIGFLLAVLYLRCCECAHNKEPEALAIVTAWPLAVPCGLLVLVAVLIVRFTYFLARIKYD